MNTKPTLVEIGSKFSNRNQAIQYLADRDWKWFSGIIYPNRDIFYRGSFRVEIISKGITGHSYQHVEIQEFVP